MEMKTQDRAKTPSSAIATIPEPSKVRMTKHWEALCSRIGERRAGSSGEQAAADYLVRQFEDLGLRDVHAEPFEIATKSFSETISASESRPGNARFNT